MDTRDLLIVQYPTKQHGFRYEQEMCYFLFGSNTSHFDSKTDVVTSAFLLRCA